MLYYYIKDGLQSGPFTLDQLKEHQLTGKTMVWREDLPNWVEAASLDEVRQILAKTPPPLHYQQASQFKTPPPVDLLSPNYLQSDFLKKLEFNYGWMVGSVITFFLGLILLVISAIAANSISLFDDGYDSAITFMVISVVILLAGTVLSIIFFCKVQYAFWTVVQDGTAKPKPGEAVGFLFIPFFSLYWIFVSFHKLSKELNMKVDQYNAPGSRASEGLSLTYCILSLCGIIPFLGYLTSLVAMVLFFVMMADHKRVVREIAMTNSL